MSPRLKSTLVIAAAVVLGFAASSLMRRPDSSPARQRVAQPEAPRATPGPDQHAIRKIMREELSNALAEASPGQTAAGPEDGTQPRASGATEPPKEARTETQLDAYTRAEALIDSRLTAGVWRADDEDAWQKLALELAQEDFATLRLRILDSQNTEALKVEPVVWQRRLRRPN
jgi:hypothetical protein